MRVVVVISGGCVREIVADRSCNVYVLDYDNIVGPTAADKEQLVDMAAWPRRPDKVGPLDVLRAVDEYEAERELSIEKLERMQDGSPDN